MQPKSEWHEKAIKWFVEVMNEWRKELERAPFAVEKMRDVWYNKLTENLEFAEVIIDGKYLR